MASLGSLLQSSRGLRSVMAAAATFVVMLPLSACSAEEGRLSIQSATGNHEFTVELVDTPESRAQGLMYRQELADDAGMLFDFKEERPVSFWMRNTYIPLDMIFIEADGTVLNVHVNARPHDTTSIPSAGPVQFVLEIPGGRSVELGIEAGDQVSHSRIKAAQ
ncbi:hypothetical protein SAMN06295905_0812 [Devosia lucknowensis]|uniref:DUF192 domain-containing protein n=1 Tax=Devosia lucknowensis TaxID=1096929 RepID=A0A1Y6EM78_9HYPH|nr:DUF192 domain-containing protein [Devosia lucknowensis]SMQ63419.1 hypothetical protein SAMN06295905_0812 [Devosia lucknowensis]